MPDDLLTAEQVAERLGTVRAATVLEWRKAGIIPAEICRGKLIRFNYERVREALRKDAESQVTP